MTNKMKFKIGMSLEGFGIITEIFPESEQYSIGGQIIHQRVLLELKQKNPTKALINAVRNGNLDAIKDSVEEGADIHENHDMAILWASYYGHLGIVEYLVEQGADMHKRGDEAFRWAAMNGHFDIVKYLVEQGANGGDAAILLATMNGHLDIVEFLKNKEK